MGLETELTGEFDARKWAAAFVATVREHPEIAGDEGTMTGWFANAIMAGYDHAQREADEPRWDRVLAPGARVEVHEVNGGYLVFPAPEGDNPR